MRARQCIARVGLHSTPCRNTHPGLRGLERHSASGQRRHLPSSHLPAHLPAHLHLVVLISRAHASRGHSAGAHAARTHGASRVVEIGALPLSAVALHHYVVLRLRCWGTGGEEGRASKGRRARGRNTRGLQEGPRLHTGPPRLFVACCACTRARACMSLSSCAFPCAQGETRRNAGDA